MYARILYMFWVMLTPASLRTLARALVRMRLFLALVTATYRMLYSSMSGVRAAEYSSSGDQAGNRENIVKMKGNNALTLGALIL